MQMRLHLSPPPPFFIFPLSTQALFPTTALAFDRVGHGVAVQGNTITITSGTNFTGVTANLHPRFEVQMVRTSAANGATLAGTFRLAFTRSFNKVERGLADRGSGLGVREPEVGARLIYDAQPSPGGTPSPSVLGACRIPCSQACLQQL